MDGERQETVLLTKASIISKAMGCCFSIRWYKKLMCLFERLKRGNGSRKKVRVSARVCLQMSCSKIRFLGQRVQMDDGFACIAIVRSFLRSDPFRPRLLCCFCFLMEEPTHITVSVSLAFYSMFTDILLVILLIFLKELPKEIF